jgi:hypothetical protein
MYGTYLVPMGGLKYRCFQPAIISKPGVIRPAESSSRLPLASKQAIRKVHHHHQVEMDGYPGRSQSRISQFERSGYKDIISRQVSKEDIRRYSSLSGKQ